MPRSVRWADLEDSGAEDEESTGCTATRGDKGVVGFAPELRVTSAGTSSAIPNTGKLMAARTMRSGYLAGARSWCLPPRVEAHQVRSATATSGTLAAH